MNPQFKDLFSGHAQDYAKFRPKYPKELFQFLSSLTGEHQLVWDCGTGNGQAAVELASYFDKVIATDPSEKQLLSATKMPNVEYLVASASSAPQIKNQSVDLVTVAQAFHWFHQQEFFNEVKRVAKPSAVLAFWCYSLAQISHEIDEVVLQLYEGILGPYWEKERALVDENYRNIQVPFEAIQAPQFTMKIDWSLEHLVGYLNTWSALQKYIKDNNKNPIESIYEELQKAWGPRATRKVHWDLGLRVSRISNARSYL